MSPDADGSYVPPKAWACRAFRRYFSHLAARQFTSVRYATLDSPAAWEAGVPTLFVGNHTTWWVGIFAWLLVDALGLAPHVLMEAVNLERYSAFKWIGTIPVRRDQPRGAYEDLKRARAYLRPGTGLWVFPQGNRRPALERPERLERGAAQLALDAGRRIRIVPVAFRYPFLSEQLPEGFLLVGTSWFVEPGSGLDRRRLTDDIAARLCATVEVLDARLAREELGDFGVLVAGRLSINKRMDRVRHRLGLLRGRFEERNG